MRSSRPAGCEPPQQYVRGWLNVISARSRPLYRFQEGALAEGARGALGEATQQTHAGPRVPEKSASELVVAARGTVCYLEDLFIAQCKSGIFQAAL